jgi:hypothetical protein
MNAGVWAMVASAAIVGCGGKQIVEGPPVGSCSGGQGVWSCETNADASGAPFTLAQCPTSFDPASACPLMLGNAALDGSGPGAAASPGFTGVYQTSQVTECFECTSNGLGLDWICNSQRWQTNGAYSCGP